MAKNNGFNSNSSKSFTGEIGRKNDKIIDSIKVEEIDLEESINAESTEEELEIEAKKILRNQNAKNLGIIMNADYYFTVYFVSKEDKNEFFEKLNADELNEVFVNGYDFSEKLGIEIEKKDVHLPKPQFLKRQKNY